jgi:hypothetical protein
MVLLLLLLCLPPQCMFAVVPLPALTVPPSPGPHRLPFTVMLLLLRMLVPDI